MKKNQWLSGLFEEPLGAERDRLIRMNIRRNEKRTVAMGTVHRDLIDRTRTKRGYDGTSDLPKEACTNAAAIRMTAPMSQLSVEQLWELRNSLLENAKRLTDDAELLLANARWPAAFESAYFAREETAKSANMFAAAYVVAEDP